MDLTRSQACSQECGGKCAVFMNAGRGDVISEDALLHALSSGWIGGAILDVFEVEPLPATSALWSLSNVVISPHVSAVSFVEDVVDVLDENYASYAAGNPLRHSVDWENGY